MTSKSTRYGLFRFTPDAPGVAVDGDERGVVDQAVDGACDARRAWEDAVPLGKAEGGGDQCRAVPVAPRDDGVEDVGMAAFERDIADLVEDEQAGPREDSQAAAQFAPRGGLGEGLEQIRRLLEADGMAVEERLVGGIGGDHGLSGALPADEHGIVCAVDEGEAHQRLDSGAADRARPCPVEVCQRLEGRQPRFGAPALVAADPAHLFFAGDELFEPVGIGDVFPAIDQAMEAERPGTVPECGHVLSSFRAAAGLS